MKKQTEQNIDELCHTADENADIKVVDAAEEKATAEAEASEDAEVNPENTESAQRAEEQDETAALRARIAELEAELLRKSHEAEMIRGQLSELSELFPDVSPDDLPRKVWEDAAATGSLAAAYALYHRREQVRLGRINELNQRNAESSTGKVGRDQAKEYFTPSEVRAMSRDEVRANYTKILDSMKRWN